jgi:hypothetical protein
MGANGAGECGENPISGKLMKNVRTKFDSKQLSEERIGSGVLCERMGSWER